MEQFSAMLEKTGFEERTLIPFSSLVLQEREFGLCDQWFNAISSVQLESDTLEFLGHPSAGVTSLLHPSMCFFYISC